MVWKSDSPSLETDAPHAVTRTRKKSPSQIRRSQRRLQEFLIRKKQLAASSDVETEAQVGITTKAERKAEQPPSVPARTPIKDHLLDSLENQPDCEAVEDVQEVDLATCKSVRNDGIPGLHYTLSSGAEKWTPVRKKQKFRDQRVVLDTEKEVAREVKAARRVKYKEHDRVPGLEIQRGCTMSSVSWIPVVPSPIAYRTRTRTKIK